MEAENEITLPEDVFSKVLARQIIKDIFIYMNKRGRVGDFRYVSPAHSYRNGHQAFMVLKVAADISGTEMRVWVWIPDRTDMDARMVIEWTRPEYRFWYVTEELFLNDETVAEYIDKYFRSSFKKVLNVADGLLSLSSMNRAYWKVRKNPKKDAEARGGVFIR